MSDYVLLNAIINRMSSDTARLRRCANCARHNFDEGNYIEHFSECLLARGRDRCHYEPSRWVEDDGPEERHD